MLKTIPIMKAKKTIEIKEFIFVYALKCYLYFKKEE